MKTSNKLLLIFALAAFLSMASIMLYAKSQMISKEEYRKELKLSGEVIERVLTTNLTTEDIEMGDNFEWILDPTSTEVVIEGDETIISQLEVANFGQYQIRTGNLRGRSYDFGMITVTVGIKNLSSIKIEGEGNAKITATSALTFDNVDIDLNGNSKSTLDLTVPELNIQCSGNGRATLTGSAPTIKAGASGNSKIYVEEMSVQDVSVHTSGNAGFYGGIVESITGSASGNAKVKVKGANKNNHVSTSGNARFTISR